MQKDKKIVIRVRGIILFEDKLLVVKHPNDTSFGALPGGHLEWGEDIRECLVREIIEELGTKPEIGRLLYVNNFIDGDSIQSVEFFFEITNANMYINIGNNIRTHAHEIAEIIWVKPTDPISILPKKLGDDFKNGEMVSDQTKFIYHD
jgi:ADP-ribose pyrophosphatase YjhB (NUDIX family)